MPLLGSHFLPITPACYGVGLTADAFGEAFAAGETDALGEGAAAGDADGAAGEAAAMVPGFATGVPP